jgi:hypothetical protein
MPRLVQMLRRWVNALMPRMAEETGFVLRPWLA